MGIKGKDNIMPITIDYHSLLSDRVIIITGMGRSGTTILGKILGSCQNTTYLFEPVIMHHVRNMDQSSFRMILMEDYLLPSLQCRTINHVPDDDSYIYNYISPDDFRARVLLRRRQDAINHINITDHKFIIKTNESQPYIPEFRSLFPVCMIIHIVRNPMDVIRSSISKGWYTDDWMRDSFMDYVHSGTDVPVPSWIHHELVPMWSQWNQQTRIALAWVTLTADNGAPDCVVRYEDLLDKPFSVVSNLLKNINLTPSKLTINHVYKIKWRTDHATPINNIDPEVLRLLAEAAALYGYNIA